MEKFLPHVYLHHFYVTDTIWWYKICYFGINQKALWKSCRFITEKDKMILCIFRKMAKRWFGLVVVGFFSSLLVPAISCVDFLGRASFLLLSVA